MKRKKIIKSLSVITAAIFILSAFTFAGLVQNENIFIIVGQKTPVFLNHSLIKSVKLVQDEEIISVDGNLSNEYDVDLSKTLTFSSNKEGKFKLTANILGGITVKEITVNVLPEVYLYAGGDLVGVKLNTQGVIAVGFEDLVSDTGISASPAKDANIKIGDIITHINDTPINTADEFRKITNDITSDELILTIDRNKETLKISVKPFLTTDGYKIGLWVREKVAGVGTLTFITEDGKYFASLGHAVIDATSGVQVPLLNGDLVGAKAISIVRGEKGYPGEIKAVFKDPNVSLGKINENSEYGLFGYYEGDIDLSNYTLYPIATQNEIEVGPATIITTLDDGKKEYDIYVEKVYKQNEPNTKSMMIRITDEELLAKTGGIIQGMSGSPIIQNGKIIGAVTHVLIDDPTLGYGIFVEWMIKNFYIRQN